MYEEIKLTIQEIESDLRKLTTARDLVTQIKYTSFYTTEKDINESMHILLDKKARLEKELYFGEGE